VGDKTRKLARLAVAPEEALSGIQGKSPSRRAVLNLLCEIGEASVKELCYFTGASPVVLTNLARQGLVTLSDQEVFRRPAAARPPTKPLTLNAEQTAAYDRLRVLLDAGKPVCALLHGVTGSGKTSVYIELIRRALDAGGTAIVMVPEIVLTPQLMDQFAGAFGDRVALLHSGLTLGERYDEWKRLRTGQAVVAVGTRSAVFAPLPDPRLIIIDEEQEYTYKSENTPRYHARDVAKYRVSRARGLLLLGSATPSVESAWRAEAGVYERLRMPTRYNTRALPEVLIADMRQDLMAGNASCVSGLLRAEIQRNLAVGEQSILFLNRRGYNRFLVCQVCGQVPECARCSVTLTYHAANGRLMCHQCGHSEKKPAACAACGGDFLPVGAGTQKVEEELGALFPGAAHLRMDTDTTGGKGAHEALLKTFRERRIPLLIGTQMVTKGLDFPNVTLVGVLDADMTLHMNDFRAHERAFGLITQVVGRAGRGDKPGRAVIQTFTPNHPVLLSAAAQDYETFYENEIALRQAGGLPPFADILTLTLSGLREDNVRQAALRVRRQLTPTEAILLQVLGPAPAPILKVNNRYRYRLTLTAKLEKPVRQAIAALLAAFDKDPQNRGVHLAADVNPY
jgi:primosomal protein N' (replication factor Y)